MRCLPSILPAPIALPACRAARGFYHRTRCEEWRHRWRAMAIHAFNTYYESVSSGRRTGELEIDIHRPREGPLLYHMFLFSVSYLEVYSFTTSEPRRLSLI